MAGDYQPPPGLMPEPTAEAPPNSPPVSGAAQPHYEPPPGLSESAPPATPEAGPQMTDPFQTLSPEEKGQRAAREQSGPSGLAEAANTGAAYVLGDLPQHLDAAAAAGHAWLKNTFPFVAGGAQPPSEAYDETLRAENAFTDAMWKKYPKTSVAGYVGGLIGGSYLTAVSAPASIVALAGKAPMVARILWQGLIGAGQNAFITGAQRTGGNVEERTKTALDGSVSGAIFGLMGGVAGEGLSALTTKLLGKPVSGTAAQAARDVGITPNVPASAQPEQVLGAVSHFGSAEATPQLIQGADVGLEKAAGTAHGMKMQALGLLHSAISRNAQLSSDAVGAVAQDVQRLVSENANPLERVNLNFLRDNSRGKQAFDFLYKLQDIAKKAPDGQIPFHDVIGAYTAINTLFDDGDHVVPAIQHAFKKWISNAFDSHLISGDAQAFPEWESYLGRYAKYADVVSPSSTLGKVLKYQLNGQSTANWIDNVTRVGAGQKGAEFAAGLKNLVGEDTVEWRAVRNAAVAKLLHYQEAQLQNPNVLNPETMAKGIDRLLAAPASTELLTKDQLAYFDKARVALRTLPDAAPWLVNFITKQRETMLEGASSVGLGGLGAYNEWQESHDPLQTLIHGLVGFGVGLVGPKAIGWAGARTAHIVPETIRRSAGPGAAAFYRSLQSPQQPIQRQPGQARGGRIAGAIRTARAHAHQR